MSAAAAAPLFEYVRPDLASLDIIDYESDGIRIACLALDIIGGAKLSGRIPEVKFNHTKGYIDVTIQYAYDPANVQVDIEAVQSAIVPYCITGSDPVRVTLRDWKDVARSYSDAAALELMHAESECDSVLNLSTQLGDTARDSAPDRADAWLLHETWGDWDICKPTFVLTADQVRHPPPNSMLACRGVRELLATLEKRHSFENTWVFKHGPNARDRFNMWNNRSNRVALHTIAGELSASVEFDENYTLRAHNAYMAQMKGRRTEIQARLDKRDAVRQRLARHLASTNLSKFINMARDPICPWKDMRFFHGSTSPGIQSVALAASGANSSGTYNKCALSWKETISGNASTSLTAFTSPVFTESLAYGSHVYTYKLNADPVSLKMLDMRNDNKGETINHETLDMVKEVFALSGCIHGNGPRRTEMAIQLHELFKDSGVDGIVMNTDVEWIWFNPASVLDWVAPGEAGLARTLLVLPPGEEPKGYGNTTQRITPIDMLVNRPFRYLDMQPFLDTCAHIDIKLSAVPITRWTMDTHDDPFMTQFAAGASSGELSRLWTPFQLPDAEDEGETLSVYECEYHALWNAIEPDFDNLRMTDHLMDGHHQSDSVSFQDAIPYNKLCSHLVQMGVKLLVLLPNGHTQIMPPLRQPGKKYDRRMWISSAWNVPTNNNLTLMDMPVRTPYESQAVKAARLLERKRDNPDDDSSSSSSKQLKTSGRAQIVRHRLEGRLCIC